VHAERVSGGPRGGTAALPGVTVEQTAAPGAPRHPPAVHATAAAGLVLAVALLALLRVAAGIDFDGQADVVLWTVELAVAVSAAGFGAVLLGRPSGRAAGWLLELGALGLAVSALTDTGAVLPGTWLPFGEATLQVQLWANVLGRSVLLAAVVVALPDRLLPGRAGGGPGTALAAALVVGLTAGAVTHARPDDLRDSDVGFGNRAWLEAADAVPSWLLLSLLAVHVASLLALARQRAADPTWFQVAGWGLAAAALPVALPQLAQHLPDGSRAVLATLAVPLLPVVSVVAVLRAISWTADRLVSRTLVWGALSAGVALAQGAAVAVAAVAGGRAGFLVSVVAGVLVAVGFAAARGRLQAAVDRLVWGARRDPWTAAQGLADRMQAALGPEELLPDLASAVADAFGAEVAVELEGSGAPAAHAGHVGSVGREHRWPLVHQGERLGALVVRAPREAPFRPADLAALGHLAGHAAAVAHGVRASTALRTSRLELVAAVEEERRRLQRELHDGLGPSLAGVALGLRAARNQLPDGEPARLLARLTDEVEASVAEVRRVVAGLRPTVLDQLGLVAAVQAHADRCSSPALAVDVQVPAPLPALSAATEVAAYRIAVEAMTNVVRHAGARACDVRLGSGPGRLVVEVLDDGAGLPGGVVAGVGLTSMRERSAGVGGHLVVQPRRGGGTRVLAELPTGTRRG
jgi:signal transduction histidine kinase